jgi:TonB family protein
LTALHNCPTCGCGLDPDASGGLCPACLLAAALDPLDEALDTTLIPGQTVGVFRIEGLLGKGGMATVYEAYDPSLERAIALKVLPPEFLHEQAFARRFRREARVIARLEHPNIVPIYASGIDQGIPWMSMRLLSGGSLGTLLERLRLPIERALPILRQIAEALDYAHARGIVHRDIKPTNILLDGADHVCVADFGLAYIRDFNPLLSRSTSIAGTPHYMAPEQGLGKEIDHRADIYSLGVLAYEMLTGTLPFTAESPVAILLKHVNESPPSPKGLPSPLLRAVHKALAKEPAERWESAGAFVDALESGPLESERLSSWQGIVLLSRRRWTALSLSGAVVVLTAGLFLLTRPQANAPSLNSQQPPNAETLVPASALRQVPVTDSPSALVGAAAPVERAKTAAVRPVTIPTDSPEATATSTGQERVASSLTPEPFDERPPASRAASAAVDSGGVRLPAIESPQEPARLTLLQSGDAVTAPVRRRTVTPAYPAVARAAHITGEVGLKAMVAIDGRVTSVTVVRPVHPLLDDAATKAVLQYQYSPGLNHGVPQAAAVDIIVSFRLE